MRLIICCIYRTGLLGGSSENIDVKTKNLLMVYHCEIILWYWVCHLILACLSPWENGWGCDIFA